MEKVVIGLSGGVDSSTAALLLKERGYEVVGMTLRICRNPEEPWEREEVAEAERVAESLGIPFKTVTRRTEFDRCVEQYFAEEYFAGRTPNPCIVCNKYIKWRALMDCADEIGAYHVATGHYARIRKLDNGRYAICRAVFGPKDQSYVLYMLPQEALARTILPVGDYEKPEIRRMAGEAALPSAETPDSQDICFVSGRDYAGYLKGRWPERMPEEGDYVSAGDGRVLGRHRGYIHYTIGQRKGLGIAGGHPLYVSEIRPQTNEVLLSDADVFGKSLTCSGLHFMGLSPDELPEGASREAVGRVRYAHAGTPCTITRTGEDEIRADFDEPVRAITPGQAAVFYNEEGAVLCGGSIDRGM